MAQLTVYIFGAERMDPTSAVRSDVLPAVGSFVIPGAVASAPWVALAWGEPHNLKTFVDSNPAVSTVAGVLLIVGVGLLVESIGTYVESGAIDKWGKKHSEISDRWYDYLRIIWVKNEPIGQRYLRKVLTSFKFELNLFVSLIASIIGLVVLGYHGVLPIQAVAWIDGLSLVLCIYLWRAARADAELLHRLRGDLIDVARKQSLSATIT